MRNKFFTPTIQITIALYFIALMVIRIGIYENFDRQIAAVVPAIIKAAPINPIGVSSGGSTGTQGVFSVTQYGITWTFDQNYPVGRFTNGDWWVIGNPVTITAISPAPGNGRNGTQINKMPGDTHGFDSRVDGFSQSLSITLPKTITPPASVISTISNPDQTTCCIGTNCGWTSPFTTCSRSPLQTAAVLTVLKAPPAEPSFRPPYVGSVKPLYPNRTVLNAPLPNLPRAQSAPAMNWVESRFARVQLDDKPGWTARYYHPTLNGPDYYAEIARDTAVSLLALSLEGDKIPALMNYVQYGIDLYHMYLNGASWGANAGQGNGRKLPVAFAGWALGNQAMMDAVKSAPYDTFSEDGQIYWSPSANFGQGKTLWGEFSNNDAEAYWRFLLDPYHNGNKLQRDPYGLIDGPYPSSDYQYCCTTQGFKAAALALHLIPTLKPIWNNPNFDAYVTRWVNSGAWGLPDSCAPLEGTCSVGGARCTSANADLVCAPQGQCVYSAANYRVTFGPDPARPGQCIRDTDPSDGIGRFTERHGLDPDGGLYGSLFVDELWRRERGGSGGGGGNVIRGQPIGFWKFDETAGVTALDSSSSRNHGAITGAQRVTQGRFGGALAFDGVDDWVTIADAAPLDLTQKFTLAAWVKPALTRPWQEIIFKEDINRGAYGLYAANASNRSYVEFFGNQRFSLQSSSQLPLNVWSYVAATYDGSNLKLYINAGAPISTPINNAAIGISNGPLRLGGNSIWGEFFKGEIDEVRIYDYALTQEEVINAMNNTVINVLP